MLPDEKEKLLALFDHESRWCQDAEARDTQGDAVHFDSEAAVAWDLVGGLCSLFGWGRALELFSQVSRSILGRYRTTHRADSAIAAMAALTDFNDQPTTNFATIVAKLQDLPVARRHSPAPGVL
jgi:hypothetical protein